MLLAAAVPAVAGQSVLDLGCGVGAAALCLGARVPGLHLAGIEVQARYADLARRNGIENRITLNVHTGDIAMMPAPLRQRSFDHVIVNPPYFHAQNRIPSPEIGRETAQAGDTPLVEWVDAATRRLAPKGRLSVILRADRLPDLMSAIDNRLGSIILWPFQARISRPARMILLTAQKGGRSAFILRNPLILHSGQRHDSDRESYTESVRMALRDARPLI